MAIVSEVRKACLSVIFITLLTYHFYIDVFFIVKWFYMLDLITKQILLKSLFFV